VAFDAPPLLILASRGVADFGFATAAAGLGSARLLLSCDLLPEVSEAASTRGGLRTAARSLTGSWARCLLLPVRSASDFRSAPGFTRGAAAGDAARLAGGLPRRASGAASCRRATCAAQQPGDLDTVALL
jgi:hypothetical protein